MTMSILLMRDYLVVEVSVIAHQFKRYLEDWQQRMHEVSMEPRYVIPQGMMDYKM